MVSHTGGSQLAESVLTTLTDSIMPEIDRARALLNDIGWADVGIQTVTGGTVNKTFHLSKGDESWYLRIGPTDVDASHGPHWLASNGLQREQLAMAYWANHSRYFAETIHTDFSRSQIGSDWVIQKAIPGEPWESLRAKLSYDQTKSLWQQLGVLMAELHRYIGQEFGGLEPSHGVSCWSELCRWDATGLLTDAHKYELKKEPFEGLCELVDRSIHELDQITKPRLIHSDLSPRHVMVVFEDNEPVISGLLDLEFARFADGYSESVFVTEALKTQPDPVFAAFEEAYGAERPDRDSRVRSLIYQVTALGWWATDAMRRNRPTMAQEAVDGMRKRLEEDKHIW